MNEKIFFAHANGFPSEVYSDLFEDLKGFDIDYIPMLAHGKHQIKNSWRVIVPEIVAYFETRDIDSIKHLFPNTEYITFEGW